MINFAIGVIFGALIISILAMPNDNCPDNTFDEQEAKRDD